ncbi:DctP family TRAP transporter solute-binding subunit [Cloacibacillus sp.]
MKKGKGLFIIAQMLVVILLFVSCAAAAPAKPEYEWKYGEALGPKHSLTIGARAFADKLGELTNGRVKLTVYDSGSLGTIQELIEGVDIGSIEFIDVSMAPLSTFSSKFYAFNLPYLFNNVDVAYAFEDGPMGQELKGPVGKSGISVIGFMENGMRSLTSNVRIVEPKDVVGRKIRTMSNKVHMTAFEKAGASAVPMVFSELFTALQQNVIDGQENPLLNIQDMSFYEVQKYLTLTEHFYDITVFCVNTKLYNSVPADIRAAIDEAATYMTEVHRRECIKQNDNVLDFFKQKSKMEIIRLTPEQKAAWKKAMMPTYDIYRKEIGAEYLDKVIAEVARLQAQYDAGKLDTSRWR